MCIEVYGMNFFNVEWGYFVFLDLLLVCIKNLEIFDVEIINFLK